jgi:hypothetical protein
MSNHWQYNGVAAMAVIVDWCDQHIAGEYVYHGWETIVFHTGRAQSMFLLKWR